MPTQEDRAISRIKLVSDMIRDKKRISFQLLESWALVYLGVSERTLNRYVAALISLGLVTTDVKKKEVVWGGSAEARNNE